MQPTTNENGFTLIEVMIAIMIFSIGICGAARLFQNSAATDYKNARLDQANRLLTSFSEETNLASLDELPQLEDASPKTPDALRAVINDNFDDNTYRYMIKHSDNGIKLYRVVFRESTYLKEVLLCVAWTAQGYTTPRMIFRTVVKPTASDT